MRTLKDYLLESRREYAVDQWMDRNTARQMKGINAVGIWLTHADERDLEFVKMNNNVDHIFFKKNDAWFEYVGGELIPIQTTVTNSNPKGFVCYSLNLGAFRREPSRAQLDNVFSANVFRTLYVSIEEPRTITEYAVWYDPRRDKYIYSKS